MMDIPDSVFDGLIFYLQFGLSTFLYLPVVTTFDVGFTFMPHLITKLLS